MTTSESLWRNRAFTRLWIAHVTSGAGTAITNVALPLAAVLVLGATPTQMGLLAAAGSLPNLLFGLVAGVWVDRVRRKPFLIWADIGRSLLLVTIPVAAWLGQLSFLQIWLVTFGAGTLTVFFQIAAISVLPALVEKRQLVEANSKLSTSDAVIAIAGPAAAGGLVQLFSAPRAILVDAFSYLLSALALGGVAEEEPKHTAQSDREDAQEPVNRVRAAVASIGREVGEGVFELLRTPLLRALTVTSSLGMLAGSISAAVQMLFLVDQLDFTPSVIGIVAAFGGAGSLLGAVLAGKSSRLLQAGKTLVVGKLLWIAGTLLLAGADLIGYEVAAAAASRALVGLGSTIYFVNQISLRQAITSVRLLGRVTAARRFVLFGVATVGAFIGGALGEAFGLRATLLVGSAALTLELVLLLFSTVRNARIE